MKIHPALTRAFPDISPDQLRVISHLEGPLLVIAGPGSGKTYCLILRALNLLLLGEAQPHQLLLCTFTEKAAFQMRDRLAAAARQVGYDRDLSQLLIGTIHGICNQFLTKYRHQTDLAHSYETLDDLTQMLFIHDRFDEIVGEALEGDRYLNRWTTRWTAIEGARDYFNKITEEMIDPQRLVKSGEPFLEAVGHAYLRYEAALIDGNCVDFAHLQRHCYDLLQRKTTGAKIRGALRHVLVDEYQDTNYIQEQLLIDLTRDSHNLCVVGDEDQSLYRFRGATVRNILEFPQRFPDCKTVKLTTNYRSHRRIVEAYDRWMGSADWTNPDGPPFRYPKKIVADPEARHARYPALLCIWGKDKTEEARRFAELVDFLKKHSVVDDVSSVALLLHSVRGEHSAPYIEALKAKGIEAFCPRARAYFEAEEIRAMVGALALILGYFEDGQGDLAARSVRELAAYVNDCIRELARRFPSPHPLALRIQHLKGEVDGLRQDEALDQRLADLFYDLLAYEPLPGYLRDENRARRLAIFSTLISTFQSYYHFSVITHGNRQALRLRFFNSFLRLLHDGGINDYEDPDQPFPKGFVQIMTIHQAKGLEFSVVAVGSLNKNPSTGKQMDRELGPFYHRAHFEPEARITGFDRMRLHYVAFSRPQHLLVLTAGEEPRERFAPIWDDLDQWPHVDKDALGRQRFMAKPRFPLKKRFSFTGDLRVYETCPRQYEFFRYLDFTPSRSAVIFFGLLVHQTIEGIHRSVLDGHLARLNDERVRGFFDRAYRGLLMSDVRPPGREARDAALRQVLTYVKLNRADMRRIVDTEVDVSLEKDGYILSGKVDLLLGGDGKLELLDFKTQARPTDGRLLDAYERQLCTYGHILERRHSRRPERLLLYWTAEETKSEALTVIPYRPERAAEAGAHFDRVVGLIQRHEFGIQAPPERKICKECDIRAICTGEGVIAPF